MQPPRRFLGKGGGGRVFHPHLGRKRGTWETLVRLQPFGLQIATKRAKLVGVSKPGRRRGIRKAKWASEGRTVPPKTPASTSLLQQASRRAFLHLGIIGPTRPSAFSKNNSFKDLPPPPPLGHRAGQLFQASAGRFLFWRLPRTRGAAEGQAWRPPVATLPGTDPGDQSEPRPGSTPAPVPVGPQPGRATHS